MVILPFLAYILIWMKRNETISIAEHKLELSHLDKVLYPETGFTKGDAIAYYLQMAPLLLPGLKQRWVSLPGWKKSKQGSNAVPSWIKVRLATPVRGEPMAVQLKCQAGLVWAVNSGALELQVSLAKGPKMEAPTHLIFHLEPQLPATILEAAEVALDLKKILQEVEMESFCQATGEEVLQISVPLNRLFTFTQAKGFGRKIAQLLEKRSSEKAYSSLRKKNRAGKIFLNTQLNQAKGTSLAFYCLRHTSRPWVVMPMPWAEVEHLLQIRKPMGFYWEAADALLRLQAMGDLFNEPVKRRQKTREPASSFLPNSDAHVLPRACFSV